VLAVRVQMPSVQITWKRTLTVLTVAAILTMAVVLPVGIINHRTSSTKPVATIDCGDFAGQFGVMGVPAQVQLVNGGELVIFQDGYTLPLVKPIPVKVGQLTALLVDKGEAKSAAPVRDAAKDSPCQAKP